MKPPRTLPPLEEPSFRLANPAAVQYAVLGIALLAPVAAWVWVFGEWQRGTADVWHGLVALIMAGMFAGAAWPENWRSWVVFAADPRGVYLANIRREYVFVPWADVGPISVGVAGRGSNRQRTVILMLRMDAPTFERLLGKYQKRAVRDGDADGFVPYGIGNAMRNVEETRHRIESIRGHAPAGNSGANR